MAFSKCLITRTNWALDGGASFSGGSWQTYLPLTNMQTPRAQEVAQATSAASGSTKFDCDLGATRKVGLIELQHLVTTTSGTIRVRAGTDATFASNNYDSTTISSVPLDTSPWGDSATKYNISEYANLGYPRYFIPTAIFDCRYIRVEVVDTGASPPLQIGHFGAWEVYEFKYNFSDFSISPVDEASLTTTAFGSTFITRRYQHQLLRITFGAIDAASGADFLERILPILRIKGLSDPICIVPFPADGSNVERTAIWGLLNGEIQVTRRSWSLWSAEFVVNQLA